MNTTPRTLTPDQAIALAQQNMQATHHIKILAFLGQVDVPASFAQVGGGGVTRPDGLAFSQWSNEKGELLIMFAGLGLFSFELDLDKLEADFSRECQQQRQAQVALDDWSAKLDEAHEASGNDPAINAGDDDWVPEYPPEDERQPEDDPHDYGPYDYEDEPNPEQDALGDLHASQYE